uniref:HERV-K_3q12.3 provirus ancestral Gag polyprotein n=1 Tax=Anthurium amnicola TaxID=1678845 RepID=A0A1D1XUS1_9ARAE
MSIIWIIILRQLPPWVKKLIHKTVLSQIFEETQIMNMPSDVSVINITHERDSPSECMDTGTSSQRKKEVISNNALSNACVSSAGQTGEAGPENERLADGLSHEPEELTSHLAQVVAESEDSNEESLPDHVERGNKVHKNHYSDTAEALISDALLFKKCHTPEELTYIKKCKDVELASFEYTTNDFEYTTNDNKVTTSCSHLHPLVECPVDTQTWGLNGSLYSQQSHFKLLSEAKNELTDKFVMLTSQPSDEEMDCATLSVSHKENSVLIESSLIGKGNSFNQWKGKERVLNAGSIRSVSEKDDSNESAESSNRKEPCGRRKRVWGYGQEIPIGSKNMRKSIDENSCSGSHVREDSSFMNWISSVTKGIFRSDYMETHSSSLISNAVPGTQRNIFSGSKLNNRNNNATFRSMGFGSFFKALYCPRLGKPVKTVDPDYQGECVDFKDLHFNNRPARSFMDHIAPDDEAIELHEAVPISNMRKDQDVWQFREPSLTAPSIHLRNSPIQEIIKHKEEYCNLYNVGSSSSSFQNGFSCPFEGKEASELGSFEANKFSNLSMKGAGRFPASLWITRFLPKAAPVSYAIKCNQDRAPVGEKLTDDGHIFLHHSQNDIVSSRDCSNSENVYLLPEDQRPDAVGHLHKYPVGPMGSCCSTKVYTDQKTKSNLNPILPSQTLKKLEATSSVFAKRDAFRQIQSPEDADDVTAESATCFFCGKIGHSITTCSDVIESELEDLLRNMNSYGRAEKPSCMCIRCFLHGHWAVACPYASLCSNRQMGSNASVINPEKFSRNLKGCGNETPLISNYGIRMCKKGEGMRGQPLSAYGIPCEEISGNATEVQTSINVDFFDIVNFHGNVLSSYQFKDDYRKSETKGKQIYSTSREMESIGNPLIHIYDMNNKPDEQHLVFERIRKLHLSRTDIIRNFEPDCPLIVRTRLMIRLASPCLISRMHHDKHESSELIFT